MIPIFGKYSELITLDLTASCWYDVKEFEGKNSWNKAGGVGAALSKNNQNALLLAWRPAATFPNFEAAIYENDSKGGRKVHSVISFSIYDTACLSLIKDGRSIQSDIFYVTAGDNHYIRKEQRSYLWAKTPSLLRRRGPWFGGLFPAPHDMEKWVSFRKINGEDNLVLKSYKGGSVGDPRWASWRSFVPA
jgi:hypothetical protein